MLITSAGKWDQKEIDGFFFKTEFQRKTIFLLTEIRDLLQNSQRTEAHSQLPGSEFNFSVVDTIDDLNSVERSLEDKDFRTKMVCLWIKYFILYFWHIFIINKEKKFTHIIYFSSWIYWIFLHVEDNVDESWRYGWGRWSEEMHAKVNIEIQRKVWGGPGD